MADGAVVYLVHAWNRIHTPYDLASLRDLDDRYEHSLPERFERVLSALAGTRRFTFKTVAREGPPAQTLLAVARTVSADLIVAGRRGFRMLERLVIGSVSTSLVRGASCSVLIVPDRHPLETARLQRHMTGTSTVVSANDWAGELHDFSLRNHHRRTALEIDDLSLGAQIQESGYLFAGASYDPHNHRIQLMFELATGSDEHLTRSIGDVHSVATTCNPADVDFAVCIVSAHGSALLTFLDDHPRQAP